MKLLKSKKALSTVVTTLIILGISVLLATFVTFCAINVIITRVHEESLQITKLHVWCTKRAMPTTTFMITNTGGRDVVMRARVFVKFSVLTFSCLLVMFGGEEAFME